MNAKKTSGVEPPRMGYARIAEHKKCKNYNKNIDSVMTRASSIVFPSGDLDGDLETLLNHIEDVSDEYSAAIEKLSPLKEKVEAAIVAKDNLDAAEAAIVDSVAAAELEEEAVAAAKALAAAAGNMLQWLQQKANQP